MADIIGIRFKKAGKIYYFSPADLVAFSGDKVIVETTRGIECGTVVIPNREIDDSMITAPLKPIIRKANENDLKILARNKEKEKQAFNICIEKIKARGLKMHLIEVEYTFDNSKMLFYFTAENRVDFRELVKDLASVFKTRIELRQIGVKDEAKFLGGIGVCGREFCCKSYLGECHSTSIKMAKEQGLSLNPTKISGACGRLMCCLKNEQSTYEELLKITPNVGALDQIVSSGQKGTVTETNIITGKIKVKTDKSEVPVLTDRNDIKILKDTEIKVNKDEMKALKKLEGK